MTESDAHILAQDDVEACDASGHPSPLGLLALVAGGLVFLLLFGVWMLTNWITGDLT